MLRPRRCPRRGVSQLICKCSEVIFLVEFHVGIDVRPRSEPWLWLLEFLAYDEESFRGLLLIICIPEEDKWLVMDFLGG